MSDIKHEHTDDCVSSDQYDRAARRAERALNEAVMLREAITRAEKARDEALRAKHQALDLVEETLALREEDRQAIYPRQDGDVTIIGPECFADSRGTVISYKGENYYPADDMRPVDLNELVSLLEEELEEGGEHGIWGDYGPPDAPVGYLVGLIRANASAIENRQGMYSDEEQNE